jgi:hypothetical protein
MVISLVGAGVLWMFGKHVERKLSIKKKQQNKLDQLHYDRDQQAKLVFFDGGGRG